MLLVEKAMTCDRLRAPDHRPLEAGLSCSNVMDDGIELNFAVGGGVQRVKAPKGGRWTDR